MLLSPNKLGAVVADSPSIGGTALAVSEVTLALTSDGVFTEATGAKSFSGSPRTQVQQKKPQTHAACKQYLDPGMEIHQENSIIS